MTSWKNWQPYPSNTVYWIQIFIPHKWLYEWCSVSCTTYFCTLHIPTFMYKRSVSFPVWLVLYVAVRCLVYILYSIQWDAVCTYYTAYTEMPYVHIIQHTVRCLMCILYSIQWDALCTYYTAYSGSGVPNTVAGCALQPLYSLIQYVMQISLDND